MAQVDVIPPVAATTSFCGYNCNFYVYALPHYNVATWQPMVCVMFIGLFYLLLSCWLRRILRLISFSFTLELIWRVIERQRAFRSPVRGDKLRAIRPQSSVGSEIWYSSSRRRPHVLRSLFRSIIASTAVNFTDDKAKDRPLRRIFCPECNSDG